MSSSTVDCQSILSKIQSVEKETLHSAAIDAEITSRVIQILQNPEDHDTERDIKLLKKSIQVPVMRKVSYSNYRLSRRTIIKKKRKKPTRIVRDGSNLSLDNFASFGDEKMSENPDIQSIEISDCDLDELDHERDENIPIPIWCSTNDKLKATSKLNQQVNPESIFGEMINTTIDVQRVMGDCYKKQKMKAEASWSLDKLTAKERKEYSDFKYKYQR